MKAFSLYRAGKRDEPGGAFLVSDDEVAGGLSSPVSSGWLKSHSTARSTFPSYNTVRIRVKTNQNKLTVSLNAFFACAFVKPMSASIATCSAGGSGALPLPDPAVWMGTLMSEKSRQLEFRVDSFRHTWVLHVHD